MIKLITSRCYLFAAWAIVSLWMPTGESFAAQPGDNLTVCSNTGYGGINQTRFDNLRAKLSNPDLFGANGTLSTSTFSFVITNPVTADLTANNCDIWFSGNDAGTYTDLAAFVGSGGFVMAGCDAASNSAACAGVGFPVTDYSNISVSFASISPLNPLTCDGGTGSTPTTITTAGGASSYFSGGVALARYNDSSALPETITDSLTDPTVLLTGDIDMWSVVAGVTSGGTVSSDQDKFAVNSFKYAADSVTNLISSAGGSSCQILRDSDGDGIVDSQDSDDDNDGISDVDEGIYNNGIDQQLVNNNGFEEPVINSSFAVIDSSSLPSWETTATDGKAEIWASGHNGVPAYEGNQFAELNANLVASLFQDVATPPGAQIGWSVAHRGRSGVESATVSIGVPGTTLTVVETLTTGTSDWILYSGTYEVPAGQTTTRFSFDSIGNGGSLGNFIDAFQLTVASLDSDADGTDNHLDFDTDNDGLADIIEGNVDTDGDEIPDYRDTDSDNDGVSDSAEDAASPALSGLDSDADGIDDAIDYDLAGGTDLNGNGISDALEPTDTDGDGSADNVDIDSDDDGIADSLEGVADSDADGIANYLDGDSDNDGITDRSEGPPPIASTLSFASSTTAATAALTSAASTGFSAPVNTSNAGVLSLSSTSPGESSSDPNGSWRGTTANATVTLLRDPSETLESFTVDVTTVGGFDDGLYLVVDGVVVVDFDQNDWLNADVSSMYANNGQWTPWSNMGNPAFRLLINSRGEATIELLVDRTDTQGVRGNILDVIPGSTPNAVPQLDIENGIAIGIAFSNHGGLGGISDVNLAASATFVTNQSVDTDGDTIADFLDLDSDNDGISDLYESGDATGIAADLNRDGTVTTSESADADSDGLIDLFEDGAPADNSGTTPLNSDADLLADFRDLDSDGDGLPDAIEAQASAGYAASFGNDGDVSDNDSDGDGVLDSHDGVSGFGGNFNTPINTDGSDTVDYLDLDSDNDTLTDAQENGADVTTPASYADPNGNIDDPATDLTNEGGDTTEVAYREDATAPAAPVIVVDEDSDNDGNISLAELSGSVDLGITLPADALEGHTLLIGDGSNSQAITLTAADISLGSVSAALAAAADGSVVNYFAQLTDLAGNTSSNGSDSATFDLSAPGEPVVVLTEDSSNDGLINSAEADGLIDVTVTLPVDAQIGDSLVVDNGSTSNTVVLDADDIDSGTVSTSFAAGSDGDLVTVSAALTDVAGNLSSSVSDSASYDTSEPAAPAVIIEEDANNDALISSGELSGDINVSVALSGDEVAGDTLSVSDATTTNTFVLSSTQIAAAQVSTTFAAGSDTQLLVVSATVTDIAGNTSAVGSDTASYDLSAPSTPVIIISEDSDNNALIGTAELNGDTDIAVTLPADAVAGDTLTFSDGVTTQSIVLAAADILAGSVVGSFSARSDTETISVSALILDVAGNQSGSATDSASYDLTAPGVALPVITDDIDNNALVSTAEALGDTDVQVLLPVDAVAGDTLLISDGTSSTTVLLSTADISLGSVSSAFDAPLDGATITVTATLSDAAGNLSDSATDSATYDLSAPDVPLIVLTEDVSDDGLINASELDGLVDVAVTLPGDAQAGDTLSIDDGTTTNTLVLSAADISQGSVTATFAAGSDGQALTVTASVSDPAGNTSQAATDSASYDVSAPAAAQVAISEDSNNDALISIAELSGDIDVIVTLPANALAGDSVVIDNGTDTNTIALGSADISTGSVATTFAAGADNDTLTVSATLIDVAGNASPDASDAASYDLSAPSEAQIAITEDGDNNALIGSAESNGVLDVQVTLPADAVVGDTLLISNGSTADSQILDSGDIALGSVSASFSAGLDGDTVGVSAVITDTAGNSSVAATDTATYDLLAPDAATVTIAEDIDNNALIGSGELSGTIDISVVLPANAVAGDTLLVSDGTTTHSTLLTEANILAGGIGSSFAAAGHGDALNVSALLSDAAGNISSATTDSAVYDLEAPALLSVVIDDDANNDGLVSIAESSAQTTVTITLAADVVSGDVLSLSDGNSTISVVLTATDIANGSISSTLNAPANGSTITVSASVSDAAGNQSGPVDDSASYDLTSPDTPVIVIVEDGSNDGLISQAELDGQIDVTVTLPGNAGAGDTLTLSDGTSSTTITLSAADITAGNVSTTFTAGNDGETLTVSATVSDASGNQSSLVSDSARYDVTAPSAPTLQIAEDSNNDALISIAEQSGNIDISVSLPADAEAGDTLAVSNGATTNTTLLSAADISAGIVATSFPAQIDGQTLTATASVTDLAGNQSAVATDSASHDLSAPSAPLVVIDEDGNNDGLISASELNASLDVSVSLPIDAVVGDTLEISDGNTTNTRVLTAAELSAGSVVSSFTAGADGSTTAVVAALTDSAGNRSVSATDSASYDLTAPAAAVLLIGEDINDDGLVSSAEAVGDSDVVISLAVDASVGDRVTISDGLTTTTVVLSAAELSTGLLSTAFAAPDDGGTLAVTATVTDLAGNQSPVASDSAVYDLIAPDAPQIVLLEDVSDDGLISDSELAGQIDVSVTLPANAVVGDTVSIDDGTTTNTLVLSAADISAARVDTSFAAGSDGDTLTVSASITDAAGNSSASASDDASYDTSAPSIPDVLISEDSNDDALISIAELSGDIDIAIALPADAVAGDTLTIDDGTSTSTIVLSAADIAAATVVSSLASANDGDVLNVTASLTDIAGNHSASAADSARFDLSAPGAATIVIAEDADNNALIGIAENLGELDVTVSLPADAVAGDTLQISDGASTDSVTLSAADIAAGEYSSSFAAGSDSQWVGVSAVIIDSAGNTSASAADSARYDLSAPSAPVIAISDDIDDNALISATEAVGDSDVLITLPLDAEVGDTLSVTDGTTDISIVLNAADIANGTVNTAFAAVADGESITVSASVTDVAGNLSPAAGDDATYDLTAPAVPLIVLTEDSSDDGLISNA